MSKRGKSTKKKTTKKKPPTTGSAMTLRVRKPKLERAVTMSDILSAPAYTRATTVWEAGTKKKKGYLAMVCEAIMEVGKRGWAAHATIYKYVYTNYEVPEKTYKATIRRTLNKALDENILERKNGRYFKVKKTKKAAKAAGTKKKTAKKTKAKKTTKKTTRSKTTTTRKGRPPKKTAAAKKTRTVKKKTTKSKATLSRGPSKITYSKNEFKDREMQSTGPDSGVTEIVFSFDATGSMGAALTQAKTQIKEITERLFSDVPDGRLRVAIVAHGDYCARTEKGCLDFVDLTDDAKKIQKFINGTTGMNGGDSQECYELVLEQIQNFDWTEGSTRILVMIGDEQPHPPNIAKNQMANFMKGKCFGKPREIDWKEEADHLWGMGVKIYGVHALNRSHAANFYRGMAARTCGTYVTLNDFKVVNDMILAICFREVSREKFMAFEKEVMAAKRMDSHRRRLFRQVSDGLPPAE